MVFLNLDSSNRGLLYDDKHGQAEERGDKGESAKEGGEELRRAPSDLDEKPPRKKVRLDSNGSSKLEKSPLSITEALTFETARTSDLAPAADRTEEPVAESPASKANPRPWEIEGERIAEWHSVRTEDAEDNFEPDGPEDGDNAAVPVEALNWEDHETEEAVVPETPVTETVSEPIDPPVSETTDPVADHIAEHVAQDLATAPLAEEGDTIDAQQYEAVLDEEMLRELVGEIVRQELQGPLGERITRNVRKLVRREINRALTARSFNDE